MRPIPQFCWPLEHQLHRRAFLGTALAGPALGALHGLALGAETAVTGELARRQKRVLLLWLAGGASQFEMWDPKPGRLTGGPFEAISTSVPGTQIGELMPRVAGLMHEIAVVRSLNTEISAHEPAADLIHVGRKMEPALHYPEVGTVLARELAVRDSSLPAYVSLFLSSEGHRRPDPGFLGGRFAPLHLRRSLRPENIDLPAGLSEAQFDERERLRALLSRDFQQRRAGDDVVSGYNSAYDQVRGLMRADHLFDLNREPAEVREAYGRTAFGEQCLLARRLLEAGVPVVKVARGFWDSHHDNFESHRELVGDFDHVFSVLLLDLKQRGLLDSTLIVVLSEFGRTPKINQDVGRDHYADAWSCAFAGSGIRGGTVYGRTDRDGKKVTDGEASAGDLLATIYQAAGLDPAKHYLVGPRPVPLAPEEAHPMTEILNDRA